MKIDRRSSMRPHRRPWRWIIIVGFYLLLLAGYCVSLLLWHEQPEPVCDCEVRALNECWERADGD